MKKKIKITELKISSFVTDEQQHALKAGRAASSREITFHIPVCSGNCTDLPTCSTNTQQ